MPIYEYECPLHGIIEYLVRDKTEEPKICKQETNTVVNGRTAICIEFLKKVMSSGSFRIEGVYPYSLERPQDIRARERNQALKTNP